MKIEVCPADGASSCDATAESVRCGVIALPPAVSTWSFAYSVLHVCVCIVIYMDHVGA